MNSIDKLKEVEHQIHRILVLISEYNPYRDPLIDIQESIKRFLLFQEQNHALAEEYSESRTLKRFLLKRGFMPNNEADAEAILDSIIKENDSK